MNNNTLAGIFLIIALVFSIWFIHNARKNSRELKYNKENKLKRMERLSNG
jgi:hypothetical protein